MRHFGTVSGGRVDSPCVIQGSKQDPYLQCFKRLFLKTSSSKNFYSFGLRPGTPSLQRSFHLSSKRLFRFLKATENNPERYTGAIYCGSSRLFERYNSITILHFFLYTKQEFLYRNTLQRWGKKENIKNIKSFSITNQSGPIN